MRDNKGMTVYFTLLFAPGPSKFAVDPAAENGDVPLYARSWLPASVCNGHVLPRVGTKSEGPGAL